MWALAARRLPLAVRPLTAAATTRRLSSPRPMSLTTRSCSTPTTSPARATAASPGEVLAYVEREPGAEVARLYLDRGPANSLSLPLVRVLRSLLEVLEADPTVRGLVLASTSPKIFCAGLEFAELENPDPARLREFWSSMQRLCHDLLTSRLATVSAIDGHAPAGGCVLALCCDWRVMSTSAGRTGLNEAALGLPPPPWICELLQRHTTPARAEQMLQRGTLVDPEEAVRLGLVDRLVGGGEAEGAAGEEVARMLSIRDETRVALKQWSRAGLAGRMMQHLDRDTEAFAAAILSPGVQANIAAYTQSLKKAK